jgi:tetratricopeptide (TPR) repeat protein
MMRSLLHSVLLIVFCSNLSPAQSVADYNARGDQKIKANDYSGALTEFTSAVKLTETATQEYLAKKAKYSKMTTYEIALAENGRGQEPQPDWAWSYYNKGLCEKEMKNTADALKDFDIAVALNPKLGEAYYERALLKYAKEDNDNRCADLRMAADLGYAKARVAYEDNFCWNNSVNHYKEGLTKLNIKNYDAALVEFDLAIRQAPDSAFLYLKRGECFSGLTKYEDAIADFKTVLKSNEHNVEAHYELGLIYEAKDDHQKAFEEYTKAIQDKPSYYEAYMHRAMACESQTQYASAIYDYSSAIRLKPDVAENYYKRGVLKRDNLKNDKDACEDFCKAFDLGYTDAEELAKNCRDPYYKKPKESDPKKKR